MSMLLMQSQSPGLLTINGQFCGRLDASPHTYMTHADERIYLSFLPFDDALAPLTREMRLSRDALDPPAEGLYAISWPESVHQLELRPSPRIPSPPAPSAPPDMPDAVRRPLRADRTLFTWHAAQGDCAAILDSDLNRLHFLCARRITWDTPEILQAFEDAGDFVGHASLCTYRLTPDGFTELARQNIWANGAPRWPASPAQTLRAYLEALQIGARDEAAHYLSAPDRAGTLAPFDRVVDLRFPLAHAPEPLPLALGVLRVAAPTLARVQAVCARARSVRHAQGAYKLDEIRLLP